MRCLARRPDERYASAIDLADDLRRYLSGEPVHARPATTVYLLRKRVARHRYRYTAGAAAALAAVVGAAFYVHDVGAQRNRAERALLRSEQRRQEAEQNLGVANEHRAVALASLNELVFAVERKARDTAVPLEFRDQILGIASKGLAQLGELPGDEQLAAEQSSLTAVLHRGDLHRSAGRHAEAAVAYQTALQGFRRRHAADPDDARARRDLLTALLRLGRLNLQRRENLDAAGAGLREAVTIAEKLGAELPDDPAVRLDRVAARFGMGDWLLARGDAAALDEYRAALALSSATQPGWAAAAGRFAAGCLRLKKADAAALAEARRMLRAVADGPDPAADGASDQAKDLRASHDAASALSRLAEVESALGDTAAARRAAAEAVGRFTRLTELAPDRADWRADLASALFVAGESERAAGAGDEARVLFGRAADVLNRLAAAGPLTPPQRDLLQRAAHWQRALRS